MGFQAELWLCGLWMSVGYLNWEAVFMGQSYNPIQCPNLLFSVPVLFLLDTCILDNPQSVMQLNHGCEGYGIFLLIQPIYLAPREPNLLW